ncbi:hypothetical protein [Brevundimonas subvibrioides]|uniref:hypothetical protein n=1 Tax=Brevundimonas subvibrioides TaxID=74313 RepID=UPI0022B58CDE|nr:hypothetical protein [Brevundimonas subvibrioides]
MDWSLENFGTDPGGKEVKLTFTQNKHAIRPDTLPSRVMLACTGNVKLAFNDLNAIAAPLNDEGIEIAYFDEECDWLCILSAELARVQKPLGLDVRFVNGLVVRIFCDEATFTTA